ncbi:hypothetical protein FACS1894200_10830 [Spirochaetia bacterium]|nr:hypothetical protein FACS1894200_10830 [Spirochaetia bacterium]
MGQQIAELEKAIEGDGVSIIISTNEDSRGDVEIYTAANSKLIMEYRVLNEQIKAESSPIYLTF